MTSKKEKLPLSFETAIDYLMRIQTGAIDDLAVVDEVAAAIGKYGLSQNAAVDNETTIKPENILAEPIELQLKARMLIKEFRALSLKFVGDQHASNASANLTAFSQALKNVIEFRNHKFKAKQADSLFDDVNEYKEKSLKLIALELCFDSAFQYALDQVRSKWQLVNEPPLDSEQSLLLKQQTFLLERLKRGNKNIHAERLYDFKVQCQQIFFGKRFGLDIDKHYGLVIAALCFGLTLDTIQSNWKDIWALARQEPLFDGDVILRVNDADQFMSLFLALAYVANSLLALNTNFDQTTKSSETNLDLLPESVREWVDLAFEMKRKMDIDFADVPKTISTTNPNSINLENQEIELFVRVKNGDSWNTVKKVKSKVHLLQLMNWGNPPKNKRVTRTTLRDFIITTIYEENDRDMEATVKEIDKSFPGMKINNAKQIKDRPYQILDATRDQIYKAVKRTYQKRKRS